MRWIGIILTSSLAFAQAPHAGWEKLPDCSHAIVNPSCKIVLDREDPVTPPAIQMGPGNTLLIVVNKRGVETVEVEYEFKDIVAPDPTAAIGNALLTPLKSFSLGEQKFGVLNVPPPPPPPGAPLALSNPLESVKRELERLQEASEAMRQDIEGIYLKQVKKASRKLGELRALKADPAEATEFENTRKELAALIQDLRKPGSTRSIEAGLENAIEQFNELRPKASNTQIKEVDSMIDVVAASLKSLDARWSSIVAAQTALEKAGGLLAGLTKPSFVFTDEVGQTVPKGRYRTATAKVSVKDMFTEQKKPLATLNVTWGRTRWELSAGAMFSLLVSRKFETPPLIVGGVPQKEGDKAISVITESVTRPVVVPMVLAHYRLGEWPMRGQRFGFLLTGGAGVNPFTSSADFGFGASLAFRNFMVTPLLHFGRDLGLTNGLSVGQAFVGSPPSLSTERNWTRKFGVAISIGTPIK